MINFLRKFENIFEFYKSTLAITIALSLLGFVFGGFETFKIIFVLLGFWISVLFKEVNSKNEYLFYYSNGISKLKLLGFSFLMNVIYSFFFIYIFNQIRYFYD